MVLARCKPGGRWWVASALVLALTACTALPVAPLPFAPPVSPAPHIASQPPAAVVGNADTALPPALPPSPMARLTDFFTRRWFSASSGAEKPPPADEAQTATLPETAASAAPPVDEKYRLTGAAALALERGHASWYGGQFHGRRTASGEQYDKYALTAAHKTLPFGTIVRVRSVKLGREVDVRINDRGPFTPGRVIDVSQAAAEALGLMGRGTAEVTLNLPATPSLAPVHAGKQPHQPRTTRQAVRSKAAAAVRLAASQPLAVAASAAPHQ